VLHPTFSQVVSGKTVTFAYVLGAQVGGSTSFEFDRYNLEGWAQCLLGAKDATAPAGSLTSGVETPTATPGDALPVTAPASEPSDLATAPTEPATAVTADSISPALTEPAAPEPGPSPTTLATTSPTSPTPAEPVVPAAVVPTPGA